MQKSFCQRFSCCREYKDAEDILQCCQSRGTMSVSAVRTEKSAWKLSGGDDYDYCNTICVDCNRAELFSGERNAWQSPIEGRGQYVTKKAQDCYKASIWESGLVCESRDLGRGSSTRGCAE